jgi:hypothetical protein
MGSEIIFTNGGGRKGRKLGNNSSLFREAKRRSNFTLRGACEGLVGGARSTSLWLDQAKEFAKTARAELHRAVLRR